MLSFLSVLTFSSESNIGLVKWRVEREEERGEKRATKYFVICIKIIILISSAHGWKREKERERE